MYVYVMYVTKRRSHALLGFNFSQYLAGVNGTGFHFSQHINGTGFHFLLGWRDPGSGSGFHLSQYLAGVDGFQHIAGMGGTGFHFSQQLSVPVSVGRESGQVCCG